MSGLYLHIPFCRRKCPYCDFYSLCETDHCLEGYPELLTRHLAWAKEHGWPSPIDTVYFGGGTPSLLHPAAVAEVLQSVDRIFGLAQGAEITLEANPGTVTQQSLEGFRSSGVNRLSLGIQSCSDRQLALLGRLHNRQDGIDAVRWARRAGFDNLSLDLMFALPGQSAADLEDELLAYLALAPEHLSCYGLTAEPQTPFHASVSRRELSLPDESFYADAFLFLHEQLTKVGFDHYEIANYARDGRRCRHNLGYWRRRSCLGVGAGAHSFHADHWGSRWEVPPDLATYRQTLHEGREPMLCLETFDRDAALRETLYLGLRTVDGVSDSELIQRFGSPLQSAFPEAVAASRPWLTEQCGRWSFTPSGWLLFDRLILPFL